MSTCTSCTRPLAPGGLSCAHCGTPSDATNLVGAHAGAAYAGATASSSGPYGPTGDAPTNVGTPYGQPGGGYGGGYGGGQGGGYGGGGDGGGYGGGQGGGQGGGYGGGYGGDAYGGGYGGQGGPPPSGGKGKWIAIWSAVAALVIVVAIVVVYLTVLRDDDNEEGGSGGGGGEETTDTAPEFTLNSYNDIPVVDGVATVELEADAGDIIVMASDQEDLSDPEGVDFDESVFAIYQDWDDGEGLAGWDAADDGTQTVEFTYDGADDLESVSIYVNVISGDPIAVGDEIELEDTEDGDPAPVGAAIIEDLDGTYSVPDTMYATSTNDGDWQCHDTETCTATGNGFALVTEAGLAFDLAEGGTEASGDAEAEWTNEGTVTDDLPLSDPSGTTPATWAKTFAVTVPGALSVDIDSQYEQQDIALVITNSGGNVVCEINERGVGEDEKCDFSPTVGTYTATVTAAGAVPPSAEPTGTIVGYLY